jgi:hypothetical protein
MEVTDGWQLDALWGWYCATGDIRAVERVVSVLRFMGEYGAAARYAQTAQTPRDRERALQDALFQAASWSLQSLMQEHPPLKATCEAIFAAPDLDPNARVALALCLEKVDPQHWRVVIDPNTGVANIQRLA